MADLKGNMDPGECRDLRQQMIGETNAFLAWAFSPDSQLKTRIPTRRVDKGGFTGLLSMPGAKAALAKWWNDILGASFWGDH